MKLGVLTNLLGSVSLEEALKYFSSLGLEMVEIGCGGYPGNAHANPDILLNDDKALEEFKALHAKCYCYRDVSDHKLYLTVAGINKEAVSMLNDLDDFEDGFCFDKDDASVHKNLHTYISDQPDITIDGHTYSYRSGINMRPTSYTIKQSDEYERMLEFIQQFTLDDLNEITLNTLKGVIDDEETIL